MSDDRSLRTLDRLVLFWVVFWIVLGAATGFTLWRASELGDTVSSSGRTLSDVGSSLSGLSDLPLVPERPREIGDDVQVSGAEITARGGEVKRELRLLGILLGIAVVGIPVSPVLGLYLPLRVRRGREASRLRRTLRRTVEEPEEQEALDRWLADRARTSLTYEEVRRVEQRAEDRRGLERGLADAELGRMGLRRPPPSARA